MNEPRHGDPQDDPDVPADSGLSDAYTERMTPAHLMERIANRGAEQAAPPEPRHGDPFDDPDIPGDSGLGDEDREATMSPEVKAAIIKRRLEKIPAEATAGRRGWILIENEGAIFRGPGRGSPMEVWTPSKGWRPYAGADRPRGVEWGSTISEAEAIHRMLEWAHEKRPVRD